MFIYEERTSGTMPAISQVTDDTTVFAWTHALSWLISAIR
jgi:hypothetical protein